MRKTTATLVVGIVLGGALAGGWAAAAPLPQTPWQRPGVNQLASLTSDGHQGTGSSYFSSISDNGRFVAFGSSAPDLIPGDTNGHDDIFVRDLKTGKTSLVSHAFDGGPANGMSMQPQISADGRHVVFLSYATNLFHADDTWGLYAHVYVRDLETDALEQVNLTPLGTSSALGALRPTISGNGRMVAFHSSASDLVDADANNDGDVFVVDRETDKLERVSVGPDGEPTGDDLGSFGPMLSRDGRFVVFYSEATNLVEGDENGFRDYFIRNLETDRTELISVANDGTQGNADSSQAPAGISADGRYVSFQSLASNLVPRDTNGATDSNNGGDVFVRDRVEETTVRVSVTSVGEEMGESHGGSMSGDGRYVAFNSIKPGEDPNSFVAPDDVFLHDRVTGTTEMLSVTAEGESGDADSTNAVVTPDARFVVWQSNATNLTDGDTNTGTDILVRDRGVDTSVLDVGFERSGATVDIHGLASMQGVVLVDVRDNPLDGDLPVAGADLLNASVTYRPELADVLFRATVNKIDRIAPGVTGSPLITYGFTFDAGESYYEIRARRLATTVENLGNPEFNLYRCNDSDKKCTRTGPLRGGYGTAGEDIRVSLPLTKLVELVGAPQLSGTNAFTASDDPAELTPYPGDEVFLPARTIPASGVAVAVAPTGTVPAASEFAEVAFDAGRFTHRVTLPLADEGDTVWIRACVSTACGTRTIDFPAGS